MKKNLYLLMALIGLGLLLPACKPDPKPDPVKAVESIVLSPTEHTLKVGESVQFELTLKPEGAKAKQMVWHSSDASVLSVDANGLAKALKVGQVEVLALVDQMEAKCTVTVETNEVKPQLELDIQIVDVKAVDAKIKVTPSVADATYYFYAMPKTKYDEESAKGIKAGHKIGIYGFDKSWYDFMAANSSGKLATFWDAWKHAGTVYKGEQSKALSSIATLVRSGEAYVAYAYGLDEKGVPNTELLIKEFNTKEPAKSENKITIKVLETFKNGCKAQITTTNDDTYYLDMQPASFVDFYKDKGKDGEMMYRLLTGWFGKKMGIPLFKGNKTITTDDYSVRKAGTDYYIICTPYDKDNYINGEVQYIKFQTALN